MKKTDTKTNPRPDVGSLVLLVFDDLVIVTEFVK